MKYIVSFFLVFSALFANQELVPVVNYLVEIADSQNTPIFGIGGHPGVGKTTLSKQLVSLLQEKGVACKIVRADDFYISRAERERIGGWSRSFFKADDLHRVLSEIKSGKKSIKKPAYDQMTGEVSEETLDLTGVQVILFEGSRATCAKEPDNYHDYCIASLYVEALPQDIFAWKWQREQTKPNPRSFEEFKRVTELQDKEYAENVADSIVNAKYILFKNSNHDYTLGYPPPFS